MLHRPEQPTSARAVVLCNALGFAGSLTQRPFRELARTLNRAGITVVRFDYAGTGDSLGGDWQPARVKTWIASVNEAVGLARSQDGIEHVDLVGFRMGATLAALYAADRHGLSGLALWAPVVRGSTYVKEIRALARLSAAGRPANQPANPAFPTDSLEVVGYEFTAETLDEIREIDLRRIAASTRIEEVLVLDRDDIPPHEDLVDAYAEAGAVVEHVEVGGYHDFQTDDETTSRWPTEPLAQLERWLTREVSAPPPDPPDSPSPVVATTTLVRERGTEHFLEAVTDGAAHSSETGVWIRDRLFGVVTSPVAGAERRDATVVMLNTGSNNRSGPGRMYTRFARYWSGLGFTVVRVDLGGAGDSVSPDPETENRPYAPDRVEETTAVVEWAHEQFPGHDIHLFGICSGAFNAFHAALGGAGRLGPDPGQPLDLLRVGRRGPRRVRRGAPLGQHAQPGSR